MPYEDDYKMWLEEALIGMNPDWICDGMCDTEFTHDWCSKYCGEDDAYITPMCLHMFYHHIERADRKTEPQYSEDDMYWLSLAEDVANGKMSDAGANQAWFEYINRKTENSSEIPNNCDTCKWGEWYRQGYDITMMDDECGGCCSWNSKWTPKTEPTTEDSLTVDKDINVRSKDEPTHSQHVQHVGSVEPTWTKEDHEAFYTFLWNVINPNEMQDYIGMFETKDEPQTERSSDAE